MREECYAADPNIAPSTNPGPKPLEDPNVAPYTHPDVL